MKRYIPDLRYIGCGEDIAEMREWIPDDDNDYETYVLYSEAQARIDALKQEFENIAHMGMDAFEDYHEFKVWVQNRAKHAIASSEAAGV